MTQTQSELYKKAYVELNAILSILVESEAEKLPEGFIENVRDEMSSDYKWEYDFSKGILEQNLMIETKALLVEIYKRFLAQDSEKEKWEKYDQICREYIENKKRIDFNPSKIFESNVNMSSSSEKANINTSNENSSFGENKSVSNEEAIVKHKESIFSKILNWMISSIGSIFKK